MELSIDLGKFISLVKNAEVDTGKCDLIKTEGEQYIFDNIYKKLLRNEKVKVSDIDFDAFEEDDITYMIDKKFYDIENLVRGGEIIAEYITKAAPVTSMVKGFF